MHLRNLPLTALRTFEVAARRLSFKDAADELCVSATTVSNQIRRLEREWGCKLFIRKTRAVVLTDAGRSLSQVLTRAFANIQSEVEVHIGRPRKMVTLAVGPIFGARWLIPRLGRFRAAHPDIELVLHHSPRITDGAMMATDVAVDWGSGAWSGLEARRLMDIVYSPVASTALIAAKDGLVRPEDLARYPIIHQHDRTEWRAWLRMAGCDGMKLGEETVIVDSNVVVQAAIDGQGVALGIFPFLQNEVNAGRLVKPFDLDLAPSRSFYLLVKPDARRSATIETVCRWLEDETSV